MGRFVLPGLFMLLPGALIPFMIAGKASNHAEMVQRNSEKTDVTIDITSKGIYFYIM